MMSSTNFDAVAANNVVLQHCGQKVVYGHVMTDSGNRILIQITFDVRNVRKPLLGTSAIKPCGVTVIFNNDCDRIIFRKESNFGVSRLSFLLTHHLTNGISPCKALLMAGESATNDVVEVAYVNDGNERNDAREASAGDRRAIADAVQAGQLDISSEAKIASSLRTPESPTCWKSGTHRDTCSIQRLVCNLCCESRTKFSAQTSCGEKDCGYSTEIPDRLHVHSNGGREQN